MSAPGRVFALCCVACLLLVVLFVWAKGLVPHLCMLSMVLLALFFHKRARARTHWRIPHGYTALDIAPRVCDSPHHCVPFFTAGTECKVLFCMVREHACAASAVCLAMVVRHTFGV